MTSHHPDLSSVTKGVVSEADGEEVDMGWAKRVVGGARSMWVVTHRAGGEQTWTIWCERCRAVKPLRVSVVPPELVPCFLNFFQDLLGAVS